MYGAGKIGRGFMGQTLSLAGFELVFLDKIQELVDEINAEGRYDIHIVSNDDSHIETVRGMRALWSESPDALSEIADADIAATAVGVRNLEDIAGNLAKAVRLRMQAGGGPLNVLLAENQLGIADLMRSYVYAHLSPDEQAWADGNLGLIGTSIERMVPVPPADLAEKEPLGIITEPHALLPLDADAVRGELPDLREMEPYSPFSYHNRRKLLMHNMSHATTAYLGNLAGYTYVWEAVEDPVIHEKARRAMLLTAQVLHNEYGVGMDELEKNIEAVLTRYANHPLGDTISRVGADPLRKLRPDDRLVGALLYAKEHGLDTQPLAEPIAAALFFAPDGDPSASELQAMLSEHGAKHVLRHVMHLDPQSAEGQQILAAYDMIRGERQ